VAAAGLQAPPAVSAAFDSIPNPFEALIDSEALAYRVRRCEVLNALPGRVHSLADEDMPSDEWMHDEVTHLDANLDATRLEARRQYLTLSWPAPSRIR
jgi:hypothetical protein